MPPQDPQNPAPQVPQQPSQPLPPSQPLTPPVSGQPSPSQPIPVTNISQPDVTGTPPPSAVPQPQIVAPPATPQVTPITPPTPVPVVVSPSPLPPANPQAAPAPPTVAPAPPLSPNPVPPATMPSLSQAPATVSPIAAPLPQAQPASQPIITASSYQEGKKASKILLFIGIGVAAIVLLAGIFFAVTKLMGGIKLTAYNDSNVEILYPKGYETEDHTKEIINNFGTDGTGGSTGVSMSEKGGEEIHRSNIGVLVSASSGELKADLDNIEKNPSTVETFVDDPDVKLSDSKATRFKLNSNDAVKVTSNYTKNTDGKKSEGKWHMLITYTSKNKFAIVIIQADQSDKGLEQSVDKIFNSLKIK